MIKKLKLKFILNNMLLVGIVIVTVFSSLCLLIYFSEENKLSQALEDNINMIQNGIIPDPDDELERDGRLYDISFFVILDNNHNIIDSNNTFLGKAMLTHAVNIAMNSDYERGNIPKLNISFLRSDHKDGYLITFVSREHLNQRTRETLWHAAIGSLASLILFLYISKRLADMAIAPVEKAWNQQKQFIADASHDLKTPLTVILANNNIISSHKDETVESQMKWIESTSEEAGRMSDLINKMLELAKSEATKEELKMGETDLSEVVENSILQFEVVAFERNITIESGIQPHIIVKTHAPTFSKVLEILFDNAIKYSDQNGRISVALYQSSKKVYFSINNKGEYIKEEDLPHVFERFYRTNKEREVGGHGLGLSLAKKKCDMIGARISVESNENDGTTFIIMLKAKK